ncbi:MAG: ribonuclease HII, partial [Alphaproteobacteria bacterium]|nr:ribonuclease HII [Alphaproteobacteria bacterium]
MELFYNQDDIEAGIDEAGRGCLAGPIFAAAVIWPKDKELKGVKDSKKLTAKQRKDLRNEIEANCIDFCVAYIDNDEIDNTHIGHANMKAFHEALKGLSVEFDTILVDGKYFKPFCITPHKCIIGGDNKYMSIACASILAKTYHDDYIENLCKTHPLLEVYDWRNNMTYGTAK